MAEEGDLTTQEEIETLDHDIERLKTLYRQYFMGSLKLEPQVLRKQCYRRILMARPGKIRNTGLRFRLRNLLQKWNGYQTYWNRITRQIEAGTYKRDLERVRRREHRRRTEPPGAAGTFELSDDLSEQDLQRQLEAAVQREVAEVTKLERSPPSNLSAPASRPSERQVEEEFRRLVLERQAAGESVDGLSMDEAARSLVSRIGRG